MFNLSGGALVLVCAKKDLFPDGKEFIGSKNKPEANRHEYKLQSTLKHINGEFELLNQINIPQTSEMLREYNATEIVFQDPEMAKVDGDIEEDFFQDIRDLIRNVLFQDTPCPDDMSDLQEAVETICDVIDNFGGLPVINEIYIQRSRKMREKSK